MNSAFVRPLYKRMEELGIGEHINNVKYELDFPSIHYYLFDELVMTWTVDPFTDEEVCELFI